MALCVEGWEDRSYQETPNENSFGFVYFSDGSRVGFSQQTVWQPRTNGGGQYAEVSRRHLRMAADLLVKAGVLS